MEKQFIVIKKIAKHGNQSIIVIPRVLENALNPGTIVELTIEVLSNHDLFVSEKSFVITKKIAKHGHQAIIIIPRALESELKPGTVVKLTINLLNVCEVELCQSQG